MDLLGTSLWVGAGGGVLSVIVAVAAPARRRAALLIAAMLFVPIGVLGILSVGVVFLVAAVLCLIGAVLSRPTDAGTTPSSG